MTQPQVIPVKVQLPESEKVDFEEFSVTSNSTVESIVQNLSLFPETSHLTCYNLKLRDSKENLDENLTVSEILGDASELNLRLVPKNYTQKDVRDHVVKIRENCGLSQFGNNDALGIEASGLKSGSSKFSTMALDEVSFAEDVESKVKTREPKLAEISEFITNTSSKSSNHVMSDLTPSKLPILQASVRNLSLSGWNPVPSHLRLKYGHLLYLQVQTLELETCHITATIKGFFISGSSNSKFSPFYNAKSARKVTGTYHSLYNLLEKLSPKFSLVQEQNRLILQNSNPLNYLVPQNTFLASPWVVDEPQVSELGGECPDFGSTQLQFLQGGPDSADLYHDWNEEYQNLVDLSSESIPEKILRERLLNRTRFEFSCNAAKTAISILENDVPAINNDEKIMKERIFLRNKVLYSYAIDSSGSYESLGKEEAARVSAGKDVAALEKLVQLDLTTVRNALTTVVDYAGKRLVCQTPIPGVFNQNLPLEELLHPDDAKPISNKISYGFSDEDGIICSEPVFSEALKPIAEFFHLKKHVVWNGKETGELLTSCESKGIRGSDERAYVMDLARTTPIDGGFLKKYWSPESVDSYPHKTVFLRHELVERWFRENIEKELIKKQENNEVSESSDLVVDAAKYQFSPDAFLLNKSEANLTDEQLKQVEDDEKKALEVSDYLRNVVIDQFVNSIGQGKSIAPMDGEHLAFLMHKEGINMRYLGEIAQKALLGAEKCTVGAEKSDDNSRASYYTLYRLSVQSALARSSKHILRLLVDTLPLQLVPAIIAHFLNCLYSNNTKFELGEFLSSTFEMEDYNFSEIESLDVFQKLKTEMLKRFRLEVEISDLEQHVANNKVGVLREISTQFGFQIAAKNSFLFTVDDILCLVPRIKDVGFESVLAQDIWNTGRSYIYSELEKIQKEKAEKQVKEAGALEKESESEEKVEESGKTSEIKKEEDVKEVKDEEKDETNKIELGASLLQESLSLYEQVYGIIHPKTAQAYISLASVYSDIGKIQEAIQLTKKAICISERVNGIDHFTTVTSLFNLAYFENTCQNYVASLQVYKFALGLLRSKSPDAVKVSLLDFSKKSDKAESSIATKSAPSKKKKSKSKGKSKAKTTETDDKTEKAVQIPVVEKAEFKPTEPTSEVGDLKHCCLNPMEINIMTNMLHIYMNLSKIQESLQLSHFLYKLSSVYNGEENKVTMTLRNYYCQCLLQTSDYQAAFKEYSSLYKIVKSQLGVDHALTKETKQWVERLINYTYMRGKHESAK